ncbi:hypothetical protein ABRZ80_20520 [Vibrio vulnificus]|uniref:hypothetical protein n=1 Tax=Vibrio vulnificus TaxID=672 RepID=UPI0032F0879B
MSRPLLDEAVLKFIDAKLLKDGSITSKQVSKAFGLGRQKISSLFTKYRNDYPDNMHHDLTQKCYVRGEKFTAHLLTKATPEDYLNAVAIVFD